MLLVRQSVVLFMTENPEYLLRRSTLLELITVTSHEPLPENIKLMATPITDIFTANIVLDPPEDKSKAPIYIDDKNNIYGYKPNRDTHTTTFYLLHSDIDTPVVSIYDEFILHSGMIRNYQGQPITTTVGRYILNYSLFVYPFDTIMPYVNSLFNHKTICRDVARLLLDEVITVEQYNTFMRSAYLIGCFAEICVPCMTVKAMTTGDEVLARRDELFAKYKDKLNDPIVLVKIEDELIAMDKKYLSDDPASGWIITNKEYETCRKKMFITSGITESFSNNPGEFTFIPNALSEKLDVTKFPAMCGDIRRGSYMRGIETAKGGAVTKLILRLFQNVSIDVDDCGSNEGIDITLHAKDFNDYEGRYVIIGKNMSEELTRDNFHKYIDKPIKLRSPIHCHPKDASGFCYTCFGSRYKKLKIKQAGMQTVKISSTLMYTAMKAMHKSKISVVKIADLDDFII